MDAGTVAIAQWARDAAVNNNNTPNMVCWYVVVSATTPRNVAINKWGHPHQECQPPVDVVRYGSYSTRLGHW